MTEAQGPKADHPDKDKKEVTIFVNGDPHLTPKDEITYAEVVTMGFPDFPSHPERNYSITYERGHGEKPEGILSPGGSVKVKSEMRFRVWFTGES